MRSVTGNDFNRTSTLRSKKTVASTEVNSPDLSKLCNSESNNNNMKVNVSTIDAYIGNYIKIRRMIMGVTQDTLGKMVGVSFQQIQKYEKGTSRLCVSRLYDISKILDIDMSLFFSFSNDAKNNSIENNGLFGLGNASDGMVREEGDKKGSNLLVDKESVSLLKYYKNIKNVNTRDAILSLVKKLSISDSKEE